MIINDATSNGVSQTKESRGFTLLELLIVIAIIAILSVILVLVLNPAETLRKSRDAQRISDLSTVKTALSLYLTATGTPYLGSNSSNASCTNGTTGTLYVDVTGVSGAFPAGFNAWSGTTTAGVNGTGWIPVNLAALSGGSPLSNFPLDPSNTAANLAALTNSDLIYRYACKQSPLTFELDATLESDAYKTDDPKMIKDGGNNPNLYEVGTDLAILPNSNNY